MRGLISFPSARIADSTGAALSASSIDECTQVFVAGVMSYAKRSTLLEPESVPVRCAGTF